MKVLVCAVACDPYLGSEMLHGWTAVQCLAKDHDLWVLTSFRNKLNLVRAANEGRVPSNVRFVYSGQFREWHPNRLRARLQSWTEYINFSRGVFDAAIELQRTTAFDLVHHVTFATWRVGSPLWKLGLPFVLGPIGGNVKFPLRLLPILSPSAAGFELLRMLSNTFSRLTPSVRACIRNAAHVFTAEAETRSLVTGIRGSDSATSWLMQTFFTEQAIQSARGPSAVAEQLRKMDAAAANAESSPLCLFGGGNLIGAKGVALALRALAIARSNGVRFRYVVGGGGPELSRLQELARQLGLEQEVVFGSWSGEAYRGQLNAAELYLLPSLRDGAPVTLAEAMLAGCVPIVANCGGPACLVTEECGFRVPVSTARQMIAALAKVIVTLDRNRPLIARLGAAASQRIATTFTEANYRKAINSVYSVVSRSTR